MSDQAPVESPQTSVEERIEGMFTRGVGQPETEPAAEQPAEVEPQEVEPAEQEPTQQEPEVAEVEIDGETYQVPTKIKDRFIHHADYTRKTQELAEARRVVAASEQQFKLQSAFQQSVGDEVAQVKAIESQLAQYAKLDWQAMDTDQLVRTKHQLDQLKDAKAEIEKSLQAKHGEFQQKVQQARQQAIESGRKYVEQRIKGFNDKTAQEIVAFGQAEGYTPEELQGSTDPRFVVTLWKAQQWDKLQSAKPGIQNKASQAAPVIKPGAAQKPMSQKQVLSKVMRESKDPKTKARATEAYLETIFK